MIWRMHFSLDQYPEAKSKVESHRDSAKTLTESSTIGRGKNLHVPPHSISYSLHRPAGIHFFSTSTLGEAQGDEPGFITP